MLVLAVKLSSPGSACCVREGSCVSTYDLVSRNEAKVHLGLVFSSSFSSLPGMAGKPPHGHALRYQQAQRRTAVREVSLLFVAILAYWE